ncbi:Imm26 family immunity protein [uncultured Maribacter sp.]|uniref:Imm26 family immunity protein n=1 Tax=uncultured Maribacter sp. TaxID=431308 RepID=UPI002621817F|nr:Imm26 family immunity protein [uncultured Maribacter sp.]
MSDTYKDILKSGDIFFIPLTIDFNEKPTKSYSRTKFPLDKHYAFGRFIEDRQGSGVIIEVFSKTSTLDDFSFEEITGSGRLFSPVSVSGLEFTKKRWRVISSDSSYNKNEDSNYDKVYLVSGFGDDLKLVNLGTNKSVPISEIEAEKYESWRVWFPNQIEQRIKDNL